MFVGERKKRISHRTNKTVVKIALLNPVDLIICILGNNIQRNSLIGMTAFQTHIFNIFFYCFGILKAFFMMQFELFDGYFFCQGFNEYLNKCTSFPSSQRFHLTTTN